MFPSIQKHLNGDALKDVKSVNFRNTFNVQVGSRKISQLPNLFLMNNNLWNFITKHFTKAPNSLQMRKIVNTQQFRKFKN